MRNDQYRVLHGADGVERAIEITRALFNAARGTYETDQQTVAAIARTAQLSPAAVRRFLQPSRRPKDVSLTVWSRLVNAYSRHLNRRLSEIKLELARIEHLHVNDVVIAALLLEAKNLVETIEAAAPPRE